ncbi:IclR family transcriptional regulator C-terminal domain-containing protein [Streptomyces sp. NPDC048717]|uniref:IclR family transcriptional regulator domain-containing protein n=1 Tax=Streptomyces sp. NPDC048717 TaxID=3154928 RepID=UPI00341C680C
MSRFNKNIGGGAEPEIRAELQALVDRLAGPPDFWDRPAGDFGTLASPWPALAVRKRANSLYRLGTKALQRGELLTAADWLGEAATAGHPGALFRLAVVVVRAAATRSDDAWFLLREAARHGHGDARRLLAAHDGQAPPPPGQIEDPSFLEDLRRLLGVSLHLLQPQRQDRSVTNSVDASAGTQEPDLVLVPAPVLPSRYGPAPRAPEVERPVLTALPGGLVLPVPELGPPTIATGGQRSLGLSDEPWWSASALRPAVLTCMARHDTMPVAVPARWQTTQRARDLLLLIHDAEGVDTRTLARRTGLAMNQVARLLDWLRQEQFVDTVAGAHFAGPLMALAAGTDPDRTFLKDTLAALRDELGAAVYISTYTAGEITVQESASSDTAPAVKESAPFQGAGHASAIGKSLLAQLDFPSRMDHLSRYPSIQLTGSTITSQRALIEELDGPGPHSAQFDLFEYSDTAVCVAFSLGLPSRASSIALSLPIHEHPRLIGTARILSRRVTGLLLAHLLTDDLSLQSATRRETSTWRWAAEPRRALP